MATLFEIPEEQQPLVDELAADMGVSVGEAIGISIGTLIQLRQAQAAGKTLVLTTLTENRELDPSDCVEVRLL